MKFIKPFIAWFSSYPIFQYVAAMKYFVFFLLLTGLSFSVRAQSAENSIRKILQEQTEAWNRGDLEGFMQAYWQSDSLMFIGKSGLTYGWQQTLENYRQSYPDKEAMGILSFDIIQLEPVAEGDAYFVVGSWHLARRAGDLEGHFSLLFKNINHQWVIVADHSS